MLYVCKNLIGVKTTQVIERKEKIFLRVPVAVIDMIFMVLLHNI